MPAATMEVAPINVTSQDEIGQVARAFDQVHSEAVRLAGEQALLRSSFNAMFVNLSRRSQTLIERLARMIDNLEQTEDDPTASAASSPWTTWSPACAATRRTCCCWPGTTTRASGRSRCRWPTWPAPRPRRSSSTTGSR